MHCGCPAVVGMNVIFFCLLSVPLQEVHLEVVPIAGRKQEVNLTAVVLPENSNLTVYYWWIGEELQACILFDFFCMLILMIYFVLFL